MAGIAPWGPIDGLTLLLGIARRWRQKERTCFIIAVFGE
jgi:hypothetical protein